MCRGHFRKTTYLARDEDGTPAIGFAVITYLAAIDPYTVRPLPHRLAREQNAQQPWQRTKPSMHKRIRTVLQTEAPKDALRLMTVRHTDAQATAVRCTDSPPPPAC